MSIHKSPVLCENCRGYLGFTLVRREFPPIYCSACEGFVIHREEERQQATDQYKTMIRNAK